MKIQVKLTPETKQILAQSGLKPCDLYKALPIFNPKSKCIKCNSKNNRSEYKEASCLIKRTCDRCGYYWRELPVDYEGTEFI